MSTERVDVANNQYRDDGTGKLKLHREVYRSEAEQFIQSIRQHLTWIEGEAQVEDWKLAARYYDQMIHSVKALGIELVSRAK